MIENMFWVVVAVFIFGGVFGLCAGFVLGFNMGYDFFNEEKEYDK